MPTPSSPETIDLIIVRGDNKSYIYTFLDSAGAAYDMAGSTIKLTAKVNATDASPVFQIDGVISGVDNNIATFAFTPTETATVRKLEYDIQETTAGALIHTLVLGSINIVQDVNN